MYYIKSTIEFVTTHIIMYVLYTYNPHANYIAISVFCYKVYCIHAGDQILHIRIQYAHGILCNKKTEIAILLASVDNFIIVFHPVTHVRPPVSDALCK